MESLNYSECLAAARHEIATGKAGKAFPWYLLAVQLMKDASEREKATGPRGSGCHRGENGYKESCHVTPSETALQRIEGEVVSAFIQHTATLLVCN